MIPKQGEIEVSLLRCLDEMGGRGTARDIYARIIGYFPNGINNSRINYVACLQSHESGCNSTGNAENPS